MLDNTQSKIVGPSNEEGRYIIEDYIRSFLFIQKKTTPKVVSLGNGIKIRNDGD